MILPGCASGSREEYIDFENKTPIKGAILDTWQAATNGFYENQDEKQPDYNLRGRFKSDENGTFEVTGAHADRLPGPD